MKSIKIIAFLALICLSTSVSHNLKLKWEVIHTQPLWDVENGLDSAQPAKNNLVVRRVLQTDKDESESTEAESHASVHSDGVKPTSSKAEAHTDESGVVTADASAEGSGEMLADATSQGDGVLDANAESNGSGDTNSHALTNLKDSNADSKSEGEGNASASASATGNEGLEGSSDSSSPDFSDPSTSDSESENFDEGSDESDQTQNKPEEN